MSFYLRGSKPRLLGMLLFSRSRDIFIAGILLIVITAWFSMGYHHPDEHYQIWEFAKYKLGESPLDDLPWEFKEQMRPGLQPFIAFCTIIGTRFLGIIDPFAQVFVLRLLTGLMVFGLYWKWCDALAPTLRDQGRFLRLCLVLFWMFPYLNVRFSSENMSALAFLGGLLLIFPKPDEKSNGRLFVAGMLLCTSFFFRYQIAFAGLGIGAWLLFQEKIALRSWFALICGAIVALIPCFFADYWMYGRWVFAPYNYFAQNIVQDKAAGFGVSPWWWYFKELPITLMPPASLFLFWFLGLGIRKNPRHVFVWCLVPFVIGHSLIGHKEARFMFPLIFPIFYLAAHGWDHYMAQKSLPKWANYVFKFAVFVNLAVLGFRCIYPANDVLVYTRFMRSYAVNNPESTIYWAQIGPKKKEVLTPHFFQSPWMKIVVTDSFPQLNNRAMYQPKAGDLLHFRSNRSDFVPDGFQTEQVFRWYPDWVLAFNINHWQDRTRIWSVYKIK